MEYSLEYDALNRIERKVGWPEPESTAVSSATMDYDADDQLVAWNAEVTSSDANGNLVTGPLNGAVTTFSYDARDRLQSAGGLTYSYDPEGRRVSMDDGTNVTTYVHSPLGYRHRRLFRPPGLCRFG